MQCINCNEDIHPVQRESIPWVKRCMRDCSREHKLDLDRQAAARQRARRCDSEGGVQRSPTDTRRTLFANGGLGRVPYAIPRCLCSRHTAPPQRAEAAEGLLLEPATRATLPSPKLLHPARWSKTWAALSIAQLRTLPRRDAHGGVVRGDVVSCHSGAKGLVLRFLSQMDTVCVGHPARRGGLCLLAPPVPRPVFPFGVALWRLGGDARGVGLGH